MSHQQDDSHSKQFLPDLQRTVLKSSPLFDYIRNGDFKRLLGRIRTTLDGEGAHSISILSAEPQEGKTFLVAAIALGYAILLQKRVLIVNTVLGGTPRSLVLQDLYDSELKYAPVNGVARWNRMIDLISPQEQETKKSQFDTVDFMVGQFLEGFKDQYELIIVDTCALKAAQTSMMDPIVIAGQTDASLFVTSRNSMNRESITEVKSLIEQWKVKIIGSIHNVAAPERRKGGRK